MKSTVRKLSDADVEAIRIGIQARHDNHPKKLAVKFGVSAATIYSIANGRRYKRPLPRSED